MSLPSTFSLLTQAVIPRLLTGWVEPVENGTPPTHNGRPKSRKLSQRDKENATIIAPSFVSQKHARIISPVVAEKFLSLGVSQQTEQLVQRLPLSSGNAGEVGIPRISLCAGSNGAVSKGQ